MGYLRGMIWIEMDIHVIIEFSCFHGKTKDLIDFSYI